MGKVKRVKKYMESDIEKALEEIRLGNKFLTVARKYNISRTTLRRYAQQRAMNMPSNLDGSQHCSQHRGRRCVSAMAH